MFTDGILPRKLINNYVGFETTLSDVNFITLSTGEVIIDNWNIATKPQPTIAHLKSLELSINKIEQKSNIKNKYKDIMDKYACAHIKRTLFETPEYQSMLSDMYTELEVIDGN